MAKWFLAPCLEKLRDEVDERWPSRNKSVDGTIGDAAHSARVSQHNPNREPGDDVPDGAVTAIDLTAKDSAVRESILNATIGHPNAWYVINRGHIWSRTYGWKKRPYNGSNPHNDHIHVSCVQSKGAVLSNRTWFAPPKSKGSDWNKLPVLSRGDKHNELVPFLKRFLGVRFPGHGFGRRVDRAVRRYQKSQGLYVDGVVGKATWGRILSVADLPGWKL